MISAFLNTVKIPELRRRILFTLAVIVIVRLGAAITTPGVNQAVLQEWFRTTADKQGGVAALFNLFSGGALENCAIFSLGIMPYISASIMMQLLTAVIPQLGRLAREDGGRQKIMQYTRLMTVVLCIFQGYLIALSFQHPESYHTILGGITDTIRNVGIPLVEDTGWTFRFITVISLTTGTLFLMWLGDQITERGIGNGISLIITVGIVARLPAALAQAWKTFVPSATTGGNSQVNPAILVLMILFLFLVIAGVIAITQAQRKITVQYAKRVVGRKQYGGNVQYMPLKVNYSGVMPIIFAWALLLFPTTIVGFAFKNSPTAARIASALNTGWPHYAILAVLIFFFSYFWVATQFQPSQIADDLKKYGGYIPGVRPGKPTADFLDHTMTRLTFAGAVFLTIIAVLPSLLSQGLQVPVITAQFFGGTSLLIVVGVMLDTMRQVETHLIQRHYDGFLRKGRLRARADYGGRVYGRGEAIQSGTLVWLYVAIAILVIGGVAIALAQK